MKKYIVALIVLSLFLSCSSDEKQICQHCHTQEFIYLGWGQWQKIEDNGFIDCSLIVRDEDRIYEAGNKTYRRVTKCIINK